MYSIELDLARASRFCIIPKGDGAVALYGTLNAVAH